MTYIYILIAAILHYALGFLWYSPAMFAKKWLSLMGINTSSEWTKGDMRKTMAVGIIDSIVTYGVIAYLISMTGAITWVQGAFLGFACWLGFIATTFTATFLYERKPFSLYLINVGYYLVSFVVLTAILVVLI